MGFGAWCGNDGGVGGGVGCCCCCWSPLPLLLVLLFELWLFGDGRKVGFSWFLWKIVDSISMFLSLSLCLRFWEKKNIKERSFEEKRGRERVCACDFCVFLMGFKRWDEEDFVTFFGLVRNVLVGTLGLLVVAAFALLLHALLLGVCETRSNRSLGKRKWEKSAFKCYNLTCPTKYVLLLLLYWFICFIECLIFGLWLVVRSIPA